MSQCPARGLLVGAVGITIGLAACGGNPGGPGASSATGEELGRLSARPRAIQIGRCQPGTHRLQVGTGTPYLFRVPEGSVHGTRALIVAFHGAGGNPRDGLWAFRAGRRNPNVLVLAPAAVGHSWSTQSKEDLGRIDQALRKVFRRCSIDPTRVAVGGHSAGASLALFLGLVNGDLFRAVIAFSPGELAAHAAHGKPRILLAHGSNDTVIPIGASDRIVRELRQLGYGVTYLTTDGGHEVGLSISKRAIRWFCGSCE